MKSIRMTLAVLAVLVARTSYSSAKTNPQIGHASNLGRASKNVRLDNGIDPRGHLPGVADVSTTRPGQQFVATPNFELYSACGRPCWLPFMTSPMLATGSSITDNYPYERFLGNKGDKVHIVCQLRGETIRDEAGHASNIWDKVIIPKSRALRNIGLFTATKDGTGYYAYAGDLWLGNTGWHNIPCG